MFIPALPGLTCSMRSWRIGNDGRRRGQLAGEHLRERQGRIVLGRLCGERD